MWASIYAHTIQISQLLLKSGVNSSNKRSTFSSKELPEKFSGYGLACNNIDSLKSVESNYITVFIIAI